MMSSLKNTPLPSSSSFVKQSSLLGADIISGHPLTIKKSIFFLLNGRVEMIRRNGVEFSRTKNLKYIFVCKKTSIKANQFVFYFMGIKSPGTSCDKINNSQSR